MTEGGPKYLLEFRQFDVVCIDLVTFFVYFCVALSKSRISACKAIILNCNAIIYNPYSQGHNPYSQGYNPYSQGYNL